MKESDIRNKEMIDQGTYFYKIDLEKIIFDKNGSDFVKVNCPVCKKDGHNGLKKINGFTYCLCANCDTVYISPRPGEEKLEKWYSESEWTGKRRLKYLDLLSKKRLEITYPRIQDFIRQIDLDKKDVRVLDIGCGNGSLLKAIKGMLQDRHKVELHGTEAGSTEHLKIEDIKLHYGMVEKLEMDVKFEIVCCIELIEHLYNPEIVLNKIFDLLAPGGFVYISTPNWYGVDFQFIGDRYRNFMAPTHIQFFNPGPLKTLMERSGFSVMDITTPGQLDVELIKQYFFRQDGRRTFERNRVLDFICSDLPEAGLFRNDLQDLLKKYNLSGSMRCIAKRN